MGQLAVPVAERAVATSRDCGRGDVGAPQGIGNRIKSRDQSGPGGLRSSGRRLRLACAPGVRCDAFSRFIAEGPPGKILDMIMINEWPAAVVLSSPRQVSLIGVPRWLVRTGRAWLRGLLIVR
jgi:hypothetical protein